MKLLKLSGSFLLMALISVSASAQKIKLLEGDLSPLSGETTIGAKFTYDNMAVGKFDKEADYIAKKTEDYNKKEPGRGDTWAKNWVGDRERTYEPKFVELFEKESGLTMSRKKPAKYTLIFKTTFTEPGYHTGLTFGDKNALINGEVWIVETATEKVVAKISVEKVPGRTFGGFDYDTGVRIAECYADAGKYVGKFIKKKSK
jgi:hypothetical protein